MREFRLKCLDFGLQYSTIPAGGKGFRGDARARSLPSPLPGYLPTITGYFPATGALTFSLLLVARHDENDTVGFVLQKEWAVFRP